ncbi:MAG: S8 family serine peptidase [Bacteroidales bacterium]|nr:S8 family serine peptidase [Bacteroidales bacterium]
MKRFIILLLMAATAMTNAQQAYWVFLTDKAGTTFDPYAYFDAKTIERYRLENFDLYDISNYPLNATYTAAIAAIATDTIGQSRWFNAIAVEATDEEAEHIERLPFVARVQAIAPHLIHTASKETTIGDEVQPMVHGQNKPPVLTDQLVRLQGNLFRDNGTAGKNIRIAVFDGGFPRVNTHQAFRHLRDNHRIVKTWNFPNRKENVYGWNSHGTMTLSCITGMIGGRQLGLATEAEFLLARTEVELEPFKEEVWWMQAMEWADRNGANIISSSLGYGTDRYYTTDMNGTSYVARAANMAAQRGILVCNSAGNEGDDFSWRTIITPSDADSVLCVGGIEAQLYPTKHIYFSSFGPSADGRIKPDVCAFGHAMTADVTNDSAVHWVDGTSFSCPLVAGFAACARSRHDNIPMMAFFEEMKRSADLYPYYDYALGYGVPQAQYFVSGAKPASEPSFRFETDDDGIYIVASRNIRQRQLFYHQRNLTSEILDWYESIDISHAAAGDTLLVFPNENLSTNSAIAANLDGYTKEYILPYSSLYDSDSYAGAIVNIGESVYGGSGIDNVASRWGNTEKKRLDIYWGMGSMVNSQSLETTLRGFSMANHLGIRVMHGFSKPYCIGLAAEWGMANYNLIAARGNNLDNALGLNTDDIRQKRMRQGEVSLELFQRVRLVAGGLFHRGIYWDLGVYGSYNYYRYDATIKTHLDVADNAETHYRHLDFTDAYTWNWGITTRIGYDIVAIYARYRLTNRFATDKTFATATPTDFYLHLPRLEIGLQLTY